MPRYFVAHLIPRVGDLTELELFAIADQMRQVQQSLAPQIQWIHCTTTAEVMYCLYHAADNKVIEEFARRSGLPVEKVQPVASTLSPTEVRID